MTETSNPGVTRDTMDTLTDVVARAIYGDRDDGYGPDNNAYAQTEAAIAAVRAWDAKHWCAACRDLACERCTDSTADPCGHACDAALTIERLTKAVLLAGQYLDASGAHEHAKAVRRAAGE